MTQDRFHGVRKDIVINFKVPKIIENTMMLCEELNESGDEEFYDNVAESLGYQCKEACAQGLMTKEQWRTIERKYENYG